MRGGQLAYFGTIHFGVSNDLRLSLPYDLHHVLTVRHGKSYRIPQQMQAFSHSHHWEGKCGKDDSPEESMQFN
jgi:hypothetical protein